MRFQLPLTLLHSQREEVVDAGHDLFRSKRLGQEPIRSGADHVLGFAEAQRGHHDHRNRRRRLTPAQQLDQAESTDLGQLEVKQDHVGRCPIKMVERLQAIMSDLDGVGGGDEQWRGDWYPVMLIRGSYFGDYAQELAADCGDYPKRWPYTCIDWVQAARELQMDYTSTEIDGVTFWYR